MCICRFVHLQPPTHPIASLTAGHEPLIEAVMFYTLSPAENRGEHAVIHSRQLGLLPLPDPRGASFHHAPYRYYSVCLW